ncbi:MAG: hypothetical protein QXF48_02380 [Candidatus Anstonellaceae archaeon]
MQPQFLKKENQPTSPQQSPEQIQQNLQDICGKLGLVQTAAMIREIKADDHLRIFSIYSFIKTLEQNIKNKKDFDRNKLDSALTQLIGTYIFTPYGNLFVPYGFSLKLIEDNKKVLSDILITFSKSDLSAQDAAQYFYTILKLAQNLHIQSLKLAQNLHIQSPSKESNYLKDVLALLQDTNIYNTAKILTAGDTRDGRIDVSPILKRLFPTSDYPSTIGLSVDHRYIHPFYYPHFGPPTFSKNPALNLPIFYDNNNINNLLEKNKQFFERLKYPLIAQFYSSQFPFFPKFFLNSPELISGIVQTYNKYASEPDTFQPTKGEVSGTLLSGVAGGMGGKIEDPTNNSEIRVALNALKENIAGGALVNNVGTIYANILQAYLNYYKTPDFWEVLFSGSPLSSSEPFSYVLDPNKQPQVIGAYTFTPVDSPIYPANDPAIITENGANFLPYFLIRESNGQKELNCGFFVQIGGQWFHVAVDENKIEDDKLRNAFAEFKSILSNSFTVGGGIQNLTGSFNGKDTDTIAGYFAFKIQNMAVSVAQDPERDKSVAVVSELDKNTLLVGRVFYINEEELRNPSTKNLYRSPEDLNDLQKRQQAPHFPGLDILYLAEANWALATFSSKKLSAGGGTENIGGVLTYYPHLQIAALSAYGESGPITFVFSTKAGRDIRPSWSFRTDIDLGDGYSLAFFTNSPAVLSLIQHKPFLSTSFQQILKLAEDLKKAQDPLHRYFIINLINYSLDLLNRSLYIFGFSAVSNPILGISLNTPSARYTVGWNGSDGLIGGATFKNFEFGAGYKKDTKEGNLLFHLFNNQEFGFFVNVDLNWDNFSGVNVGVSGNNWGVDVGVKKVEKMVIYVASLLFNNSQFSGAFGTGEGNKYWNVGVMYGNDTWRLGFTSTYMTGPIGKKFTLNWGVEYNINNKNYLYLKATYLDQPYLQLGLSLRFP